jgi:hypothetical protein
MPHSQRNAASTAIPLVSGNSKQKIKESAGEKKTPRLVKLSIRVATLFGEPEHLSNLQLKHYSHLLSTQLLITFRNNSSRLIISGNQRHPACSILVFEHCCFFHVPDRSQGALRFALKQISNVLLTLRHSSG